MKRIRLTDIRAHQNLLVGAFLLLGVLTVVWWAGASVRGTEDEAHTLVTTCASATDHDACYEAEVPGLYPKLAVSQIFDVIRAVRKLDSTYQFCHVLAHKVGERVVAEDPAKWIEAIPLNPADGLCSNGFVHGVVGGRFRSEVLSSSTIEQYIPDFTAACAPRSSWSPSDLDRAICYHGMGHLFVFITNADLPHALAICARTTPDAYRQVCIEGVFMQIYQPLEPDDFELIKQMKVKPTKETVRGYCASYKDSRYAGACLRESWPFFHDGIKDGTAVAAFCSGQPDAKETRSCYEAVSSLVGRMSLDDTYNAAAACARFPHEWQALCYGYSAEAVLQESRTEAAKSVALCALAGEPDLTNSCLSHLVSHADFLFGRNDAQFKAFCDTLPPSSEVQSQCMQQYTGRSR